MSGKIVILCNTNNNSIASITSTLLSKGYTFTVYEHDGIPMMWIGEHCYTGIPKIEEKVNSMNNFGSEEKSINERLVSQF